MTLSLHFRPDFEYWRRISTLKIWEFAMLMRDIEPRLAADVTDENGDAVGFSDEVRQIRSAVLAGEVIACAATGAPDERTEVTKQSASVWLRKIGYDAPASSLELGDASVGTGTRWTQALRAEAQRFRDRHGTAATAKRYGVSEQRIRELFPGSRAKADSFDVLLKRK